MRKLLVLILLTLTCAAGVRAQQTIFVPTCVGTASLDTAKFTAIKTAVGATNAATIKLPFKADVTKRCKVNNLTLTSNLTLDNVDGSGISVVTGQTLTIASPVFNPSTKQMFFNAVSGQGAVSFSGNNSLLEVYPLWWGGAGDATTSGVGTDNLAAFNAAMAAVSSLDSNGYRAVTLQYPYGRFYFSNTIIPTAQIVLQGVNAGGDIGAAITDIQGGGTVFYGADGVKGIKVSSVSGNHAAGTVLRNFTLMSKGIAGATAHGIFLETPATIDGVSVGHFKGDGIHIQASQSWTITAATNAASAVLTSTGIGSSYSASDSVTISGGTGNWAAINGTFTISAVTTNSITIPVNSTAFGALAGSPTTQSTNANGWVIRNSRSVRNGSNGLFVNGNNTNAGEADHLYTAFNGAAGVSDSSYLGNTYISCESDSNGTQGFLTDVLETLSANVFLNCYEEGNAQMCKITAPGVIVEGSLVTGLSTDSTASGFIVDHSTGNVKLLINNAGNAFQNMGMTIKQGADSTQALCIKRLNLAHGITSIADTDSYLCMYPNSGASGGAGMIGLTTGNRAFQIIAAATTEDTTQTSSSTGAIELSAAKKSVTSTGALGATANCAVVVNSGTTVVWVRCDGTIKNAGFFVQAEGAVLSVSSNTITPTNSIHHLGAGLVKTITVPTGFTSGTITIIPDAAYTYDATGNIIGTGTATIGRAMTFTYSSSSSKWYASY